MGRVIVAAVSGVMVGRGVVAVAMGWLVARVSE